MGCSDGMAIPLGWLFRADGSTGIKLCVTFWSISGLDAKTRQIKPPAVHFGAFQAWMPKLAQIEPPEVHFGAFLAWMPKLAQIEPPGVHFGAFLAWMPKLTQIEPPGVHFGAFLPGCQRSLKSTILEHFWPGCQNSLKSSLPRYILELFWPGCQNPSSQACCSSGGMWHMFPGFPISLAFKPYCTRLCGPRSLSSLSP